MSTDLEELEAERERLGVADGNGNGRSIADRAADGDGEGAADELFPLGTVDGDPKKTLASLLRKNVPMEYTASLMSAEVPLLGGLLDLESEGEVLVSWQPAKTEIIPKRDAATGKITKAKVRQKLRPTYVQHADKLYTRAQVIDIAAQLGVPESATKLGELLGDE